MITKYVVKIGNVTREFSTLGEAQTYASPTGAEVIEKSEETPVINETQMIVEQIIDDAIVFGTKLLRKFAAENTIMGITQEGKTNEVRKAMREVTDAIYTGSLKDVILEARAIPVESYDSKYITAARILSFINEIEDYLGIQRSENL